MRILSKVLVIFCLIFSLVSVFALQDNLSASETPDVLDFSVESIQHEITIHERDFPVFVQKSGMIRPNTHSFYLRSNDEWTGFTTLIAGYRCGVNAGFNIAVEAGYSLVPQVYLANMLFHFTLFETKNRLFFLGLRLRFGYKYMDVDLTPATWLGQDYLKLKRN